jgi:hypothetical protein
VSRYGDDLQFQMGTARELRLAFNGATLAVHGAKATGCGGASEPCGGAAADWTEASAAIIVGGPVRDDGIVPDRVAGDGIWTATFGLMSRMDSDFVDWLENRYDLSLSGIGSRSTKLRRIDHIRFLIQYFHRSAFQPLIPAHEDRLSRFQTISDGFGRSWTRSSAY